MYKILITTSDDYAILKMIAKECVSSKKLSPCSHIIDGMVETLYVWDNDLLNVKEYILIIKCEIKNLNKIKAIINKNHNYDVPEIISINFDIASEKYRKWFINK